MKNNIASRGPLTWDGKWCWFSETPTCLSQFHPFSPRVKLHHSAFLTISVCSIHLQTNSVKFALVSTSSSTLAVSGFQLGFPDSREWRKAQSITTPGLPQSHALLHSATLCAAGKQNVHLQPIPTGFCPLPGWYEFLQSGGSVSYLTRKGNLSSSEPGSWRLLTHVSSMNILSFHLETYLLW